MPPEVRGTIDVAGARGYAEVTGQGPSIVLVASMLVLARSYRATVAGAGSQH